MTRRLNLLPPERRAALAQAQLLGNFGALLRVCLAGLLVLVVAGAGLGIGLRVLLPVVSAEATQAFLEQAQQYRDLTDAIEQQNVLVAALQRVGDERILWSRVLDGIMLALPPGVTVRELEVDAAALQVTFAGTASDRATVVALEERLRALPWVAGVTGPRDNLIERVNPPYEFAVAIAASAAGGL